MNHMLPNGEQATVDMNKISGYCLNIQHPVGGNKARVFVSVLGLTIEHAELLRDTLLKAAKENPAQEVTPTPFGRRFEILFDMTGPNGNTATVTSGWIIETGQDIPRLTSCYIKV